MQGRQPREVTQWVQTINAVLDLQEAFLAVAASAAIRQRPAAQWPETVYFGIPHRHHPADSEIPPVALRLQWPATTRFPNFLVEPRAAAAMVASPRTTGNRRKVEQRPAAPKQVAVGTDHSWAAAAEVVPAEAQGAGLVEAQEAVVAVTVTEGQDLVEVANQPVDH